MVSNGNIWAVPTPVGRTFDRAIDRAVEDFFGPYLLGRGARSEGTEFLPAIDVWESEEGYGVALDVPGFAMDKLDVTVHGNELTVTGTKVSSCTTSGPEGKCEDLSKEQRCESLRYRHREREERSFRRQVTLPESVDPDGVVAELANGVLTIKLPKAEQARVKKIQVKTQ